MTHKTEELPKKQQAGREVRTRVSLVVARQPNLVPALCSMTEHPRYVRHRTKPEWGIGRVLSSTPNSTTVFFIRGRRRVLDESYLPLEDTAPPDDDICRVLAVAAEVTWRNEHYNVYVIELNHEICTERSFRQSNPGYVPGTKPCVYVGMTGLSPEDRFNRHRAGIQAARFVRRYGIRLLPPLYEQFNSMPHDLAKETESWLAHDLRRQGYGVWQN